MSPLQRSYGATTDNYYVAVGKAVLFHTTQMGSSYTSNMYVSQDALLLGGYLQQKTQKFLVTPHGKDCKKQEKDCTS